MVHSVAVDNEPDARRYVEQDVLVFLGPGMGLLYRDLRQVRVG